MGISCQERDQAGDTAWEEEARSSDSKVVYSLEEWFPEDGVEVLREL
jgi:hypothetical protein